MLYAVFLSVLDVVLPGNALGDDNFPGQGLSGGGDDDGRSLLKRSARDCEDPACLVNAVNSQSTTGFWIVALAVAATLVVSGVGCAWWEFCWRKLRPADIDEPSPEATSSTGTRPLKAIMQVKSKSADSLSSGADEHPDRVLYTPQSDVDEDTGILELSIGPDYVTPAVSCSPYHLAWTSPSADHHGENSNQCDSSSCKLINECETESQNPEPECDQESTSTQALVQDELSMTVSTPRNTPSLGYTHGRPKPTPLERLASSRSPCSTVKGRVITPARPEYPLSPKGLFLEKMDKHRKSRQSPMHRLLDLQPRMTKMSEDSPSCRLEDSLQWDSFPFRSREDSLVWDDFMMETSNRDENDNDARLGALAELV